MPVPAPPTAADDYTLDDEESDDGEAESRYPGAELSDSDVEELHPDDFPTYFSQRNGRLFHSHVTSPYPLPVDTPEQERMNVQHRALVELMGAHYPENCPVAEVLARVPGRQKFVMDVCTGTGKWTMEMARDFPHVAFRALDIVPIATRYPLPNVQFTMHDANTPTSYADGTFDLIHARSVTMAVTSYRALITESLRLLRPGGLFLSGEWGRYPSFHPSFTTHTPSTHAPALSTFFAYLQSALIHRGLPPVSPQIAPLLARSGAFTAITPDTYCVPLGAWPRPHALRRLGKAFRVVFLRYLASVRPMILANGGIGETAFDELRVRVENELDTVAGLVCVFHTVHARRI
ncbi:S-adenosyl-L-methionine-dependent methyltransferase [Roridomyces roridus]|uniref:S-adenosyl-L-methionine-dependent methyltransferase n=1 Tax=Roridomyces roridus TaxID=1738132 RepID=A0AAD7F7R6_9AGAR|nr:S-adenosyl-L-methionine-dependent methyltransferase [Roridomyces roridus]